MVFLLCVTALVTTGGCVFDWPKSDVSSDGDIDAQFDATTVLDGGTDAHCDAGGRSCGVCNLSCGDNSSCEPDAGQCICELGRQDCNGDPWSDGCESWLSYESSHWTFYSTLNDLNAVENPVYGPTATAQDLTGDDFTEGLVENGVRIDADTASMGAIVVPNDVTGQQVFDTAEGAIRFWYQPNYFHDVGLVAPLVRCNGQGSSFEITHTDASIFYVKFHRDSNDDISLEVGPTLYYWDPGDWILVDVRWTEGDTWSLRINGEVLADGPLGTLSDFSPCQSVYVGSSSGGMGYASGILDEIMFFRRADYDLEFVCPSND